MPIFDQGYQHWQGKLSPHSLRWWAITWRGVRTQLRGRWTRYAVLLALSPCLALAAVLVIWGLIENKVGFIQPLLSMLALPEEMRKSPAAFRVMVWTLAFQTFFVIQIPIMMILVSIVGPDLISKDLRFNAMPLYFSRPLRRTDYFLGKLGVIGFYVGLVTVVPVVVAYALGVLFSLDIKVIRDTFHLLLGGVAAGFIMLVSAGTLMLAFSSLTRNSRYVSAMWIGFWLITSAAAGILAGGLRDFSWPPVFAYTTNLVRVTNHLLRTDEAWEMVDKLAATFDQTRQQALGGPGGMMLPGRRGQPTKVPLVSGGRNPMPLEKAGPAAAEAGFVPNVQILIPSRSRDPGDDAILVVAQQPEAGRLLPRGSILRLYAIEAGVLKRRTPEQIERMVRSRLEDEEFNSNLPIFRQSFPWSWSVGVLTGLFLLSVLVLTTRVKSLDRLK